MNTTRWRLCLQGPLFTPVSQAASRRVAYHTFSHIMNLDVGAGRMGVDGCLQAGLPDGQCS